MCTTILPSCSRLIRPAGGSTERATVHGARYIHHGDSHQKKAFRKAYSSTERSVTRTDPNTAIEAITSLQTRNPSRCSKPLGLRCSQPYRHTHNIQHHHHPLSTFKLEFRSQTTDTKAHRGVPPPEKPARASPSNRPNYPSIILLHPRPRGCRSLESTRTGKQAANPFFKAGPT